MKTLFEFIVKNKVKKEIKYYNEKDIQTLYKNPIKYKEVLIKAFSPYDINDINTLGDIKTEDILDFIQELIDYLDKPSFNIIEILYNHKYKKCGFTCIYNDNNGFKHHRGNFIWEKTLDDWRFINYKFNEPVLLYKKDKDEIIKKHDLKK